MLRVPLLLDDGRIGQIEIGRTRTGTNGVHEYDWTVHCTGADNGLRVSSFLSHQESDGAFVLLQKVLDAFLRQPVDRAVARAIGSVQLEQRQLPRHRQDAPRPRLLLE